MKKYLLFCVFVFVPVFLFASDVSDLLQSAQSAYEAGDISTAIKNLDTAKSIMKTKALTPSTNDYIEITNLDIIKIKKSDYIGKKVKIKTKYYGITVLGLVYLKDIGFDNPFDDSLIDKLSSLPKSEEYTFYGIVMDNDPLGIKLYIKAIE